MMVGCWIPGWRSKRTRATSKVFVGGSDPRREVMKMSSTVATAAALVDETSTWIVGQAMALSLRRRVSGILQSPRYNHSTTPYSRRPPETYLFVKAMRHFDAVYVSFTKPHRDLILWGLSCRPMCNMIHYAMTLEMRPTRSSRNCDAITALVPCNGGRMQAVSEKIPMHLQYIARLIREYSFAGVLFTPGTRKMSGVGSEGVRHTAIQKLRPIRDT